jgi:hypothetical protein
MPITLSDWATLNPTNQSTPSQIASAATIAPITFLTILSGNVGIANITPPVPHTHMIALMFSGTAGVLATGNITLAVASVVGQAMLLIYSPTNGKYVPVG